MCKFHRRSMIMMCGLDHSTIKPLDWAFFAWSMCFCVDWSIDSKITTRKIVKNKTDFGRTKNGYLHTFCAYLIIIRKPDKSDCLIAIARRGRNVWTAIITKWSSSAAEAAAAIASLLRIARAGYQASSWQLANIVVVVVVVFKTTASTARGCGRRANCNQSSLAKFPLEPIVYKEVNNFWPTIRRAIELNNGRLGNKPTFIGFA